MRKQSSPIYSIFTVMAVMLAAASLAGEAGGALFIYPKQGQDQAKQMKDQQECQLWAQQQSGYNPAMAASAPTYSSQGPREGSGLRGAAVGALGGAAIAGLSDGSAGKGAAWGAGAGLVAGRVRDRRQQEEIAAAQNRAVQETVNAGYANYERACRACLEGRGYTVS